VFEGKSGIENKVYSYIFPLFRWYISLEETFKGGALHPNEIRNINDPALTAKFFSYALVCQKAPGHGISKYGFIITVKAETWPYRPCPRVEYK
jgi:hypothetical protein